MTQETTNTVNRAQGDPPKDGKEYEVNLSSITVKWTAYTDERTKKRMKAEGRYQYRTSTGDWKNLPDPKTFIIDTYEQE